MTEIFARAGERVTTPEGDVICFVKNDLHRHTVIKSGDFHEFQGDNEPWEPNTTFDPRCIRENRDGRIQICIDGEWRP